MLVLISTLSPTSDRERGRKYPVGVTCFGKITDNEGCRLMNEECIVYRLMEAIVSEG